MTSFQPGDRVTWTSESGRTYTGTVKPTAVIVHVNGDHPTNAWIFDADEIGQLRLIDHGDAARVNELEKHITAVDRKHEGAQHKLINDLTRTNFAVEKLRNEVSDLRDEVEAVTKILADLGRGLEFLVKAG